MKYKIPVEIKFDEVIEIEADSLEEALVKTNELIAKSAEENTIDKDKVILSIDHDFIPFFNDKV